MHRIARTAPLLVALGVITLGVIAIAACNVVPELSVTGRLGRVGLDGEIAVSASDSSVASSTEGLGLEDDETVFAPRVDLGVGPLDLTIEGYQARIQGEGAAEAMLDLGGVVIEEGDPVRSKLEYRTYAALLSYDLFPGDTIDLGLGLGAQSLDFEATIESLESGDAITSGESVLLPVLVLRGEIEIGSFGVGLLASGISGKANDVDATFVNLDLQARFTFAELTRVHGDMVLGWQTMILDVEYQEQGSGVAADLELGGPYLGLTLGI